MWTSKSFQKVFFSFRGCLRKVQLIKTVRFSTGVRVATGKDVPLTSVRYPYVKRSSFSAVTGEDVAKFREILPEASRVLTDPDEINSYNRDWMGQYRGRPPRLVSVCIFSSVLAFRERKTDRQTDRQTDRENLEGREEEGGK